ncbi:MAG: c-type cytochrome [Bryobacteraceae bacterium]|nr:c-type cytochrome [Bryobacteraceae bacterium]
MRTSAIILTLAVSSYAFGAGDAAKGKDIYLKKCKSCHAEDGAGTPAMQKKYADKWKALGGKEVQAMNDAAITKAIEAVTNHKALLKTTPAAELGDIIAHIRTLKK